jgi:hypothetical protein
MKRCRCSVCGTEFSLVSVPKTLYCPVTLKAEPVLEIPEVPR